ncbi:DUF3310 domain-containing protein [Peribacillus asahii]|uniref:DUF3310 domain-containing protein n=1 Tax=Peribacillus asahii TaxID=228899 RepID=UPI00382A72FC
MKQNDVVNAPAHYTQGGIETIDYIQAKMSEEQFKGYLLGNVHKYTSRYQFKNGAEDLKKAQWYLNRLIALEVWE